MKTKIRKWPTESEGVNLLERGSPNIVQEIAAIKTVIADIEEPLLRRARDWNLLETRMRDDDRVPVARALMSILRFSFKIILGLDKDTFSLLAQAGTGILSGATPDKSVG